MVSSRHTSSGLRVLEYLVILPKGVPAIVYSLALLLMFLLVPGLRLLYGTIVPFVIAVVIVSLGELTVIIFGNLIQIGDELEEASSVGGAKWSRTFTRVVTPLTRHAIFNVIRVVFLDSIRSLAPVVLLVTPSFQLYTTTLLDSYNGATAEINTVAAASVMITLFLVTIIGVITLAEK